jgi:hypothetical protein
MNHKGRAVVPNPSHRVSPGVFHDNKEFDQPGIDEFRAFCPWANKAHAAIEDLWELI